MDTFSRSDDSPTVYLSSSAAAAHLGCSRWLITDRTERGVLATYADPLDRRRRLYKREDLDKLRNVAPFEVEAA